jgi:hypothetical protein
MGQQVWSNKAMPDNRSSDLQVAPIQKTRLQESSIDGLETIR